MTDDLYEPHEFTWQCMTCGSNVKVNSLSAVAPTGGGTVKIKGDSGVPISAGFTHAVALENGSAASSSAELKCGGFGQMVYMGSRVIIQPPAPATPPADWPAFSDRVNQAWQDFKTSGWDLSKRGANNRGTADYRTPSKAVMDHIRKFKGTLKINGGVYQLDSSDTAGISLKRPIPPTANVPNNVRSFIYHL
jgi:hypothetical protein